MRVAGVVLAAGEGRRMGAPKALLRRPDGTTWAARAAAAARAGGCADVLVTLGARAAQVRAGLPGWVVALEVPDWRTGRAAGLALALRHPLVADADAVLVTLVDLPGVGAGDVRAVLAAGAERGPQALVRAVRDGRGGHPVLLGRAHLPRALELAGAGRGLRELLAGPGVRTVEVAGAVRDADVPADLPPGTLLPPAPDR
ncbi:NTP transferase domain-containing protein [Kineococcus sp. T13]|uniref:NTP transferase domain-containing protein n=1 Tax=Kineococcus vitellinus TaxID=2696565 RepID=UPI0014133E53|nr:NTP transferase domain-containing protein [Kineococcus vitellinus]